MSQLDRQLIESNLLKKGFRKNNNDHRFYHLYYNGKKTSIRTKISHGSKYKVYGDELLNGMKFQLHFDTKQQLIDFCECPLSHSDYVEMLREKNILK